MQCQKCKKVLSKKGSHFVCQGQCEGTFHKNCVNGLAADIKNGINRIFCNNCEYDEEEDDEIEVETSNHSSILKDIHKKVSTIPGLKKNMDSIIASLSMLSEKYDILIEEHDKSKKKILTLEKSVSTISNRCNYLEKCNTALEQKINDFEQVSRKHNIEIVGVEQLPNENIKELISKISTAIDVSCNDIEWARRNRPLMGNNKPAPIIVGFKSTGTVIRDKWLAQRRKVTELTINIITGGSAINKIYINEDLTKTARALLWNTKKQLFGIYKYVWVTNGKILVKKDDGEKSICIKTESDIADLLEEK